MKILVISFTPEVTLPLRSKSMGPYSQTGTKGSHNVLKTARIKMFRILYLDDLVKLANEYPQPY